MLQPISARLASSCSRNGINDAAALTSCFGETSMYWSCFGVTTGKSLRERARMLSARKWPFSSTCALACAMMQSASSSALKNATSSVTRPLSTLRYGVSRKPYGLMRA